MSVTAQAIWYIESHLSDELSLDVIAEAVGVSRFHISRAFSVTVQTSLAKYVRARRLSRAAQALSDTWNAIWNHGLSDAGLEAADGPTLERYGSSFDGRTGSGGFEIWVPIQRQPTSRFA